MLKKLLVPLAGSQFSEAALPVARDIARRAGASICLAHVHIPNIVMVVGALEIVDEIQDAQRRDDECAYLEGLTRRLAVEGGLKVGYTILDGPPGMVLADHAQATRSDLIVMTTHARSGLQRLWLGSVADELMRRSSVPILLLPSGHDGAGSVPDPLPEPLFKRIYSRSTAPPFPASSCHPRWRLDN